MLHLLYTHTLGRKKFLFYQVRHKQTFSAKAMTHINSIFQIQPLRKFHYQIFCCEFLLRISSFTIWFISSELNYYPYNNTGEAKFCWVRSDRCFWSQFFLYHVNFLNYRIVQSIPFKLLIVLTYRELDLSPHCLYCDCTKLPHSESSLNQLVSFTSANQWNIDYLEGKLWRKN